MRKYLEYGFLLSLFCLLPAPANAQVSAASLEARLAAIFSAPEPIFLSTCSATANCTSGTTPIGCGPVSSSGTLICVGVDQDCSILERGYVQCGSQRIDCDNPCPNNSCDSYNQQFPGCNYAYDVQGQCCTSSNPMCPGVELCF